MDASATDTLPSCHRVAAESPAPSAPEPGETDCCVRAHAAVLAPVDSVFFPAPELAFVPLLESRRDLPVSAPTRRVSADRLIPHAPPPSNVALHMRLQILLI